MVLARIKQLLAERNWTVYKLAKVSGVSQSTLANMFNKTTCPTIATLELICKGFGITLAQFFDFEGSQQHLGLAEIELLGKWRQLSPQKQSALLELLK